MNQFRAVGCRNVPKWRFRRLFRELTAGNEGSRMKHYLPLLGTVGFIASSVVYFPIFPILADESPDGWGSIRGRVVFAGEPIPEPETVQAVKNHHDQKHCLSKGPLLSEDCVINKKNRGVRWVIVWLQTEDGRAPPIHPSLKQVPKEKVVVDQPCCMFTPHAVVVRKGQELLVKNSAPIPHSIKWISPLNPGGNLMIAGGGDYTIKTLNPDRLPVKLECALHSWMGGYVKVVDHPYAAITDEDGKFEMKLAPAGEYRLVMHHGTWGPGGRNGQKVTVRNGAVTDMGKIELTKE